MLLGFSAYPMGTRPIPEEVAISLITDAHMNKVIRVKGRVEVVQVITDEKGNKGFQYALQEIQVFPIPPTPPASIIVYSTKQPPINKVITIDAKVVRSENRLALQEIRRRGIPVQLILIFVAAALFVLLVILIVIALVRGKGAPAQQPFPQPPPIYPAVPPPPPPPANISNNPTVDMEPKQTPPTVDCILGSLTIESGGKRKGEEFQMVCNTANPNFLIGRNAADCGQWHHVFNDPNIPEDMTVSRRHFKITWDEQGKKIFLENESKLKTYVNGHPVQKVEIRDGDKITAGAYSMIFKLSDYLKSQGVA
jgi:hypothetical protein